MYTEGNSSNFSRPVDDSKILVTVLSVFGNKKMANQIKMTLCILTFCVLNIRSNSNMTVDLPITDFIFRPEPDHEKIARLLPLPRCRMLIASLYA